MYTKHKEHENLPYTNIYNLISNYNLLLYCYKLKTIIKQFTTYIDDSFSHTTYLHSHIQPLSCIQPSQHPE
ncbi:Hypothetical protein CKL_1610 [Clostridium kluyveri DSM 555]|uniref:Uncharacterized protein n=1 Tax=Clostridium kluyveri (strain ATCC 8527 / DSM 555 / NBRC 12016 / NCIMB 10680 / K1) TaxID=431943 RepID=A5N8M1_CLOK5|nr:Hypothetical protein CKL_1610 [Clostridium kluyveri DSM 555]